jgi:transposase
VKIHAIADDKGHLLSLMLTDRACVCCLAAIPLVGSGKPAKRLLGDKAYDGAELRERLCQRGTTTAIPNRSNRNRRFKFNKTAYRERHHIEAAVCWPNDFRRISTGYDKLARDSLTSVCPAATIPW